MRKNVIWYFAIGLSLITLIVYAGFFFINRGETFNESILNTEVPLKNSQKGKETKLPIPPILKDKNPEEGKAEFDLKVQNGRTEFFEDQKTDTLGYNGNYLGPIIKVNKGDEVKINVNNTLDESTTMHWHGLEVPGEMDGGPHQGIEPQSTWSPSFTINQPAATLWYHPHLLDKTGEQVYKGLAGLFYIEDENSTKLDIPKNHGINDIPLVVQDKRFTEDGDIPYELDMRDTMDGFMGDTILINGAISPELDVKNELVRLRILNGSNARAYDFNFSDNATFYQIASDGGFLEKSVEMTNVTLAPAERAEILVDFSKYKSGDKVTFRDTENNIMTINIIEESTEKTEVPKELVEIPKYDKGKIVRSREFIMSGSGPMVTINGKQMDMNRIDEELKLNELEEWVVSNESSGGMGMMSSSPHPFHVHGTQFQIIERNGGKPPLNEQGWKDTVMVKSNEEVKLLVNFKEKGLFMYHCHILEHEDSGMMGQFIVK
ncbi:Multicopper oxidase with three cupredoxin domains (includes cell division protein FtsP and spore coat protein CotA) [Carnobacterium iners]|uniref:Multicopper oxidase with three cupredoxin domains (Includes cell division protein FtsP and spore coat protein CotA) n=1 Tax=Carnobacterium iners TaxID=1073423 RepID=A0A1X7MW43_9LACT|nr:multicopper oxidase domain-containing protein [Carnobacterium iners]SEK56689.1 Multicopper oxidase with three cupredoxin domains (includes cell division protein FtsP and spore coat protein CotA) [Carnobacterium iners]SMH28153.1 Multicopper oxidase with three cupredoxin domains (includes cell division protein FtsP and spore coat protein CotA) [Carnobacterium iners]